SQPASGSPSWAGRPSFRSSRASRAEAPWLPSEVAHGIGLRAPVRIATMPLFGHHHEQFHEVKVVAQEDVDALGTDIDALGQQATATSEEAVARWEEAQKDHQRADHALKRAKHPEQLAAISELLEVGRYQLAAASALAHGERLPERP